MGGSRTDWEGELGRWLEPFLERLGSPGAAADVSALCGGLIGPGDRKSVAPIAGRFAPGDYDRLHHFVAAGVWDAANLETELLVQADKLVGGSDAVLVRWTEPPPSGTSQRFIVRVRPVPREPR